MKENQNLRESEMREKDLSPYLIKEDLKEVLKEVLRELVNDFLGGIEKPRKEEEEDTLLTTRQVMEILGRSRPTLWRWKNEGYLVPAENCTKLRYSYKDVKKVLKCVTGKELDKK